MGMEVEHQHAENTYPREQAYSRVYAAIPENTILGPVLHVNMVTFLDKCGIEIPIHSTATQDQTSWGNSLPRKGPIRGEFISQRSRTSPHEFGIVIGKISRKIQANFVMLRWSHFLQASRNRLRRELKNQLKASRNP